MNSSKNDDTLSDYMFDHGIYGSLWVVMSVKEAVEYIGEIR